MMGTLLITALIIFPALSAMCICKNYKGVVILATVFAVICFAVGLMVSYVYATPTGASVVIMNMIVLVFCNLMKLFR